MLDIKMIGNNRLVGFCQPENKWYFFNLSMQLVDSLVVPTGYTGDFHDIIQLPNGHYTVFAIRDETVDMSRLVPNGKPDAVVRNYLLFEFDNNKNLVFSWDAMDHYNILDATSDVNLTLAFINPFNCNSVFYDSDGNYIISTRYFDELTKINRSTGNIIWRMGGSRCRNNEFTFQNDTEDSFSGFSHQHDARKLPNGNLILFDNGNLKSTQESRVVEYQIDEANKTLRKVWEYKHNPAIFSRAMGNVQRLPGGNTIVGWGGNDGGDHFYIVTEITSSKSVALEIIGDKGIYRAYKLPYKMDYVINNVTQTGNYSFNNNTFTTNVDINLQYYSGSGKLTVEKHRYRPHNIEFTDEGGCEIFPYRWVITQNGIDSMYGKIKISTGLFTSVSKFNKLKIYFRPNENSGYFNYITTKYNSTDNTIEAPINRTGEVMVVYHDYDAPGQIQPINNSKGITTNPKLKWSVVSAGEKYRLQMSHDSLFESVEFDSTDISINEADISDLDNISTYYWRLKGLSSSCQSSWSKSVCFTTMVATPELLEPANEQKYLSTNPTFKWGRVDSATNYRIQISESEDFSNPVLDFQLNDISEYQVKILKYYTKYYWRISASLDGYSGKWSVPYSLTTRLENVTLKYPEENSIGINVSDTFRWNKIKGAIIYNIQVAADLQFHNIVIDESGINQDYIELTGLEFLKTYYWRVKAINDDEISDWSDIWTFRTTMPPPILQLPTNGYNKQKIRTFLVWKYVDEAEEYEIEISSTGDFKSIIRTDTTDKNSLELNNLDYVTNYYWRVSAHNHNCSSGWSSIFSFKTVSKDELTSPDMIYPVNQTFGLDTTLTFKWLSNPLASNYEFQLDDNSTFSNPINYIKDIKDTTIIVKGLALNKKYFWRISLVHDDVNSAWSDNWEFRTKLDKSKLLLPVYNDSISDTNPLFKWQSVEGAIYYDFELSKDSNYNNIIFIKENLRDTIFNDVQLESNSKYYWRIKAENFENTGDWSTSELFVTHSLTNISEPQNRKINLYPNPAIDEIIIYDEISNENISIRIVSISGIEKENIIYRKDGNLVRIDISKLSSGIYLLNYLFEGNIFYQYFCKMK